MIKVNGEMLEIAEGTTVAAFLKEHGYPDKMIAVECNGAIIPRSIWEEAILKDGDTCQRIFRDIVYGLLKAFRRMKICL